MKGIILAGGFGTRLKPMTNVTNKHLLPVYDRPMIYYPIDTLVSAGIKDIMIITGREHAGDFLDLLGNGDEFGAEFTYRTQRGAGGIAEALGLAKTFANDLPVAVILGDNIFEDDWSDLVTAYRKQHDKARIFLKEVPDPQRFGVATIKDKLVTKIVEKPKAPETNLAVTGLYFYNPSVWHVISNLKPSDRGELEITDVNNFYVNQGLMEYSIIGGYWSDAGTVDSLHRASSYVKAKKWRQRTGGKF